MKQTHRSIMRETDSLHRALDTGNFYFPRQSGIPYGTFRKRSILPSLAWGALCALAFAAVVAMIWAGVQ